MTANPFEGRPGVKFMRHHGRDACPCSPYAEVDVLYRDGAIGTTEAWKILWGWHRSSSPLQIVGWRFSAQGIEAATAAETAKTGSVHESPVAESDAPK